MDPITLVMLAMIGLLIIFMIRNGRKRQAQQAEMRSGIKPGAEVMLQSGIFGTIEDIDDEESRVTLRSGTSLLVVHRSAVLNIITAVEDEPIEDSLAPDDDPQFDEHVNGNRGELGNGDSNSSAADDTDSDKK